MNQMMGAATNILADTLVARHRGRAAGLRGHGHGRATRARRSPIRRTARGSASSPTGSPPTSSSSSPPTSRCTCSTAFAAARPRPRGRSPRPTPRRPPPRGISSSARANRLAAHGARVLSSSAPAPVRVRVSAELGRARPADRADREPAARRDRRARPAPDDPIDVFVNGRPFAQARLVLVDGEYAVQIVSLTPPQRAAA